MRFFHSLALPCFALLSFSACSLNFRGFSLSLNQINSAASFNLALDRDIAQGGTTNVYPAAFTATFNRPIQAATFTPTDITQIGTATGITWGITQVSPSLFNLTASGGGDGSIIPQVLAGSVLDSTGVTLAANAVSSTIVTVDTVVPTVSVGAPSFSVVNNGTSVTFAVTYSGATVFNLTTAGVTLNTTGGASCTKGVTGGTTSTPTVTLSACSGNGTVGITIAASTAQDAAGNNNAASSASATFTVDNTAPTVSIGAPSLSTTSSATPVTYAITFTGGTTFNLTTADITLNTTGGASCTKGVTSGTTATPTVTLSACSGDGTVGITVGAGVAQDAAGNSNAASSASTTFIVANSVPSIAISPLTYNFGSVDVSSISAAHTFTITNSGSGVATGCGAPTLGGSNPTQFVIGTYTCAGTIAASGNCTIDVSAQPTVSLEKSATLSVTCSVGGTVTSNLIYLATPPAGSPPITQQGTKLLGSGGAGASSFQGQGLALSADGNTLAVGGPIDGSSGATWIFTRSGSTWTQQGAKLVGTPSVGIGVSQGYSVSLSADGNRLFVGGQNDSTNTGAAWYFTRSAGVWTQQAKLVGTGSIGNANQGISVAISGDGKTALVGGANDNGSTGAVWVYTESGGTWTQQAKLVGTGGIGTQGQGTTVALSYDGNTALFTGSSDNSTLGAAWVFTRTGSSWSQQGSKIVPADNTGTAYFGWSSSLSADGNTALIGGPKDNGWEGAAWVFTRSGSTWSQQGSKLIGTGGTTSPSEGTGVALSSDGNRAIIGGSGDASSAGAFWIFTRSGGIWSQNGTKRVGTGSSGAANQGNSVATSSDGATVASGGIGDNTNRGATWIFVP